MSRAVFLHLPSVFPANVKSCALLLGSHYIHFYLSYLSPHRWEWHWAQSKNRTHIQWLHTSRRSIAYSSRRQTM